MVPLCVFGPNSTSAAFSVADTGRLPRPKTDIVPIVGLSEEVGPNVRLELTQTPARSGQPNIMTTMSPTIENKTSGIVK